MIWQRGDTSVEGKLARAGPTARLDYAGGRAHVVGLHSATALR